MSIGSVLKRLILADEPEVPPTGSTRAKLSSKAESGSIAPIAKADTKPVVLTRDPIFDTENRICGYRFCVRAALESAKPGSTAMVDALKVEAIKILAERRMAVVPLAIDDWHRHDYRQFVAANTVILLDVPDATALDLWLEVAQDIKASGARIALQSFDLTNAFADVLALADMAFLDLSTQSLKGLEFLVKTLKQGYPGLQLAVDNVSSWPERRLCMAAGVPFCLGAFMATMDEAEQSPQLSRSRLVVIEMLNLLRRDAELSELSQVTKRDPAVAMQIVGMANSPLLGLNKAVASVEQAIVLVGREWLYRSLSISMFRLGGKGEGDDALLEMSLSRARFMELVAATTLPGKDCEELFLVGLLSLLDRLLNVRMSNILARIKLPVPVVDALLRGDGPYAPYLMLSMALENGNAAQSRSLAAGVGIAPDLVEKSSLAAMTWAQEALSVGGGTS